MTNYDRTLSRFHRLFGLCFLTYIVYVLIQYFGGHSKAAGILLVGAVVTGSIWALGMVFPARIRLAGHVNLAVSILTLSAHAWNGALLNDTAWFLSAIPLLAAYLLGSRAAVAWTAVVTLVLLILPALAAHYHPQPEWVLSQSEVSRNRVLLVWLMAALAVSSARSLKEETARVLQQESRLEAMNLQLEVTNEALTHSNADLQVFASAASHDLQAPLRRSQSIVEILKMEYGEQLDAEALDWYDRLDVEIHRMQSLVRDLLAYAELDSKERIPEEIDLESVFLQVKDAVDHQPGKVVATTPLPTVLGEETHLVQLLTNLIQNALKYNRSDAPLVEIAAEKKDDGWLLAVKDNGIGMKPEHVTKVFEPFERLHSSAEFEGSGLGLAICQRTVERSGGRIWAESEYGIGSTIYFTLPFESPKP